MIASRMDKWTVARTLDEIASYIELSEPTPFRARAFERAARKIETLDADLADLIERGELTSVPGVGKGIAPIVTELVTSCAALPRVRQEAEALVDEAVRVLESIELDGLRPTLVGLARSAVDRNS